ncbi:23S rRNA (adenine(2503)-C(2))-methyltransferase RlmN [Peredibacter starrii]|uniref:23S rRNA (Adenine(2503)-C(2))-methyltransferase RlmN n=1 Tax=Peredibacter starrii TaxID=28202 RepID=A0AAX4HUL7_9BACT|nr:23S rRNA (adenine(2503)-C(2))-methyltransferase RlmN [Peredibacter starrii]WPU66875.1 23S rRNA (adenine(2503)-C(2))-methyltransferase RlmN [Peredibacter starrii]
MRTSFYQYTLPELQELFALQGLPSSGPGLMFNWHYKKRKTEPCVIDLAKKSIAYVAENFSFDLPTLDTVHESQDKTVKFLFKFKDDLKVETVLIPFNGKYTICISSQVGCAMKCSFCHTGTQGLKRNLSTEEIIGQFLEAQRWLSANRPEDDRILNIVFMGQGEPLHNFDAVKKACEIFLTQHGLSLAPHKITISTAGYLPGLQRWKAEMPKVNIAVSLHSVIKEKRDKLIPINQRYPVEDVMKFAEEIPEGRTRFVTYEYLMIKNFNDSDEDAHITGRALAGKNVYISLIPFNPFPGTEYERPEMHEVDHFKTILDSYKIPTLIRKTKGDEILAACGQLHSGKNK